MKFKICISLCIFSSTFSFSQLTLEDNTLFYVSNIGIYVEDDINLKGTNSKLYLRNESQLIQGNGNTGNSGIGELSIQQNGTVDEYAYNYWCSPVGNIDTSVNGNSPARVDLIDESTGLISSNNAQFTSSLNGISSPLTISNYWLWIYNAGQEYENWNFVGSSGEIPSGYGFTMKGTSASLNNQLYDFRGKPNNGNITIDVFNEDYTLIGNPYPSAIDIYEFLWDASNRLSIDGSLYYWEQDPSVDSHFLEDYVGGYATYTISETEVETFTPATFNTYNGDGTINTTGGSSTTTKQAKRHIPVGQGFMIRGVLDGHVTMKNEYRRFIKESSGDSEFFRSSISKKELPFSIVPEDHKRFRLNIDFYDTYTRQLVQTFHESASVGFDYGYDSWSPEDVNSDASWIINNKAAVAQAVAFNENIAIPLKINMSLEGTLRIRITDIQHFDDEQPIYVHDKLNNTYWNLKVQDFETVLEIGEYDNRFEITFSNNEQSLSNLTFENNSYKLFYNNQTNSVTIKTDISDFNDTTISIYDVSGKVILNTKPVSIGNNTYKVPFNNISTGVYIAKFNNVGSSIASKQFVVD